MNSIFPAKSQEVVPEDDITFDLPEDEAKPFANKVHPIAEQYAAYPRSMLESPAWRVLSRAGRMFVDRLAIELSKHKGQENGALPVTFEDCIEYGIHHNGVLPAQCEAQALGFCELTERGRGGNATYRRRISGASHS